MGAYISIRMSRRVSTMVSCLQLLTENTFIETFVTPLATLKSDDLENHGDVKNLTPGNEVVVRNGTSTIRNPKLSLDKESVG